MNNKHENKKKSSFLFLCCSSNSQSNKNKKEMQQKKRLEKNKYISNSPCYEKKNSQIKELDNIDKSIYNIKESQVNKDEIYDNIKIEKNLSKENTYKNEKNSKSANIENKSEKNILFENNIKLSINEEENYEMKKSVISKESRISKLSQLEIIENKEESENNSKIEEYFENPDLHKSNIDNIKLNVLNSNTINNNIDKKKEVFSTSILESEKNSSVLENIAEKMNNYNNTNRNNNIINVENKNDYDDQNKIIRTEDIHTLDCIDNNINEYNINDIIEINGPILDNNHYSNHTKNSKDNKECSYSNKNTYENIVCGDDKINYNQNSMTDINDSMENQNISIMQSSIISNSIIFESTIFSHNEVILNSNFKEVNDKLLQKENESKVLNDKITKLINKLNKIEDDIKQYDEMILNEEAEGQRIRHFCNYVICLK